MASQKKAGKASGSVEPKAAPKEGKRSLTGGRLVALVAGVAIVSLVAGALAMQFVISPAGW